MKTRAVITRTDLPDVGFRLYELWEMNDLGEKAVRRRMAPVPLTDGEADPEHVRRAKDFLRNVAREAGLEIVGEDEILGEP